MKQVYTKHGFGYWTAEFRVLLEKHGWLDYEIAPPEVLADPGHLSNRALIIVSWLPETFWQRDYLSCLLAVRSPIFLEGPFPDYIASGLGLNPSAGGLDPHKCRLSPLRDDVASWWRKSFPVLLSGEFSGISLDVHPVVTKPTGLDRRSITGDAEDGDYNCGANRLVREAFSYLIAYKRKYDQEGHFFPSPPINSLACLAATRFYNKYKDMPEGDLWRGLFREVFSVPRDTEKAHARITPSDTLATLLTAFSLGEAMHGNAISIGLFDESISQIIKSRSIKEQDSWPLQTKLWSMICSIHPQLEKHMRGITHDRDKYRLERLVGDHERANWSAEAVWLLCFLKSWFTVSGLYWPANADALIERELLPKLEFEEDSFPAALEGCNLVSLLTYASAMLMVGYKNEGLKLFSICRQACWDEKKSGFRQGKVESGSIELKPGYVNHPWVVLCLVEAAEPEDLFWAERPAYSDSDAMLNAAWARQPLWLEKYPVHKTGDMMVIRQSANEYAGIFSSGNIMASSFQVLSHMVHAHTFQVLDTALQDRPSCNTLVLEHTLFQLLEEHSALNSAFPLLTIEPWPWGKDYCLTVRHDVDRIPTKEQFQRILEYESQEGIKGSWFWMPGRLDPQEMAHLEGEGAEIGLHAFKAADKVAELAQLNGLLNDDNRIVGETLHASGGADYYQGYSSVAAAVAAGLNYTEAAPTVYDGPFFGFPVIGSDGVVGRLPILNITHNVCIDKGTRKSPLIYNPDWPLEAAANGFHLNLLNHPDINFGILEQLMSRLPQNGRLVWTYRSLAQWWSTTHNPKKLKIKRFTTNKDQLVVQLISSENIPGLKIKIINAPNHTYDFSCTARGQEKKPEWKNVIVGFGKLIRLDMEANVPVDLCIFD